MAAKRVKLPPAERTRKQHAEALRRKQIYQRSRTIVNIALNHKERSVLLDKMSVEGWQSMAGYIRDVLFGDSLEIKYVNVIRGKRGESVIGSIRELLDEIHKDLYYANYIAGEKARDFEGDPAVTKKQFALLMEHVKRLNKTMEEFYRYALELSATLKTKLDEKSPEFIETIPDDLLKSYAQDWTLAPDDPYLREVRRRSELKKNKSKK